MKLLPLLDEIRSCTQCATALPLGPRPVLRVAAQARILIIGQAPGIRVHQTGVPWNDPSGERLATWLGVSRAFFLDSGLFAIVPAAARMCAAVAPNPAAAFERALTETVRAFARASRRDPFHEHKMTPCT